MDFRPPKQQRSSESCGRILDAAEQLIKEHGYDNMTVAEVVRLSGSSVGSLYARFRNKLGLLTALQTRSHARLQADLQSALDKVAGGPLDAVVDVFASTLCTSLLSRAELYRAFLVQAILNQELREIGHNMDRSRAEIFVRAVEGCRDEIKHPDPARAARWGHAFIMAVMRERMLLGVPPGQGDMLDPEAVQFLARAGKCGLNNTPGSGLQSPDTGMVVVPL